MHRTLIPLLGTCLYLCLLATPPANAQYRLDSWTADTGLPQNYVKDIIQTRDGYLWFTTFDGLVRFDGVRFTIFNKANSPGFASNRLWIIYEDTAGDLWISTEDGRLIQHHRGRFTTYGPEQGIPGPINSLIEDPEGALLVQSDSTLLRRSPDGKFVPYVSPRNLEVTTRKSAQLNPGVSCWANDVKLSCFVFGQIREWTEATGLSKIELLPGSAIGSDGSVWLPIANVGVLHVDANNQQHLYTDKNTLPGKPIGLANGAKLILLSKDQENNYWLTDMGTMRSQPIAGPVPDGITLSMKLYADREGNIWFGTVREGLLRARPQSVKTFSMAEGLSNNNVYPIYKDHAGTVWAGTMGGLFRYDNGRFIRDESFENRAVMSIAENSMGQMIVSSHNTLWLREGERLNQKLEVPGVIWVIYPDSDGSVWIGCERGVARLKDNNTTWFTTKDGLAGDDVKVIISDGADGFWLGSFGGLTHYRNGQFKSWTERDGLPSNFVRSLYRDRDGILWIGSYDGGLARLKDGRFTNYTINDGLFNNGVFQILEDNRSNFWISSNRGIYRVNRRELNEFAEGTTTSITSVAYGKSDGMLNVECNGGRWPAGAATSDGKLWFPTQDGVAVVDPNSIPVNSKPPPVMIESFFVDRNPVSFDGEVQINPGQINFAIQYTALSFVNSANIRFKYRLEGLDKDWIEVGSRREALFSRVPPGSYTFRVIAANSDGVWNMEGAAVKVVVRPHFYRTWWFLSLVGLSVFALGFVAYKVRVSRLESARRAQEEFSRKLLASQEQERQRIAAELHDTLGQSLLIIKNRIALAQTDVDEREEQLDELSHSASSAIEECREIAYNLRPYQIDRFGLTKTLQGIFLRLNEVTSIKANSAIEPIDDLLSSEVQTSLYRIVQECVNNIIKHSQASEASLAVKRAEKEITISIEDNGSGFRLAETPRSDRGGFGLLGIAERVKMIGGRLEIDSASGTRIRIQIPIG